MSDFPTWGDVVITAVLVAILIFGMSLFRR